MKKRKNHSSCCPAVDTPYRGEGEFKAKVAFEAIREAMTLAELSKKYGVHLLPATHAKHVGEAIQIGTWKRAAIENTATAFTRKGPAPERVSAADVDKLHSVNRQGIAQQCPERGRSASLLWSGIFSPVSCMLACTDGQGMPRPNCSGRPSRDLAFGKALPGNGPKNGEPR